MSVNYVIHIRQKCTDRIQQWLDPINSHSFVPLHGAYMLLLKQRASEGTQYWGSYVNGFFVVMVLIRIQIFTKGRILESCSQEKF